MASTKVQQVINMMSQLTDEEVGEVLMDISKRVWIPQFMTKDYLQTLLGKDDMSDDEYGMIRDNIRLNDKIITFIDEETQSEYLDCLDNEEE